MRFHPFHFTAALIVLANCSSERAFSTKLQELFRPASIETTGQAIADFMTIERGGTALGEALQDRTNPALRDIVAGANEAIDEVVDEAATEQMRGKLYVVLTGLSQAEESTMIHAEFRLLDARNFVIISRENLEFAANGQREVATIIRAELEAWLAALRCDFERADCINGEMEMLDHAALRQKLAEEIEKEEEAELAALAARPRVQNKGHTTAAAIAAQTSEQERAAAKAAPRPEDQESEEKLGRTTASLGLIDRAGFWLKTPLVREERAGRIIWVKTGRSLNLALLPFPEAPAGGGSQLSVTSYTELGAPITDLLELDIYAQ